MAEGTVTGSCSKCGKAVPNVSPRARVVICLTCELVANNPVQSQPIGHAPIGPRRRWPWLVVAAVLAAGIAVFVLRARQSHEREMLEFRYPIEATAERASYLEREASVWTSGRAALLDTTSAFQPPEPTANTRACPLLDRLPKESELAVAEPARTEEEMRAGREDDPDEHIETVVPYDRSLRDRVAQQIDTLVAAGQRGRFHSTRAERRIERAIGLPLFVVKLETDVAPKLVETTSMYGVGHSFTPGHRAGVVYAFDRATGKLRCSGSFDALSSETVRFTEVRGKFATSSDSDESVAADFEDNTLRAIRESLHAVD